MRNAGKKVLVVGLDGATFDKMGPWIEEGRLPHIARLVEEGVRGDLASTIHPLSPVAWSSMVTGKNPGKLGIFGWEIREKNSWESQIYNSSAIKSETLWDILSRKGRTTCIVNVPGTFPPRKVNGFLISDWLTPTGSKLNTYPPELGDELERELGDVRLWESVKFAPGKEGETVNDLVELIRNRRRVVNYLLDNHPVDFTMAVFPETDHVQHRFWKYDDPSCPGYDRESFLPYADAIFNVYQEIDSAIGDFLRRVDKDTTVILVSDHGGGPLYKLVFINRWLMQEGFLHLKRDVFTRCKYLLARYNVFLRAYKLLVKLGLNNIFLKVPKAKRRRIISSLLSLNNIDWARSRAYSTGDVGQIYVNLKGREPEGIVSPGPEYDKLIDNLTERLRRLTDPETGEEVVTEIFRKEDIYRGDYLEMAPDLSFIMKDYGYITSQHFGFESKRLMERSEYTGGNSGYHRLNGIFVVKGPNIRVGEKVNNARIEDVTPTVLYQMGFPVPEDMDGKVLEGVFQPESLEKSPVRFQAISEEGKEVVSTGAYYTPEEEKEIKDRLRDLGYLA